MDIDQEILAAPETAETTGHHKKGSYDFVHEYICSLSSQEERESFRNRCEEVLAKREKGTVAIGSLSSTRTVKKTRTTKTSFQPCVPTEFDNLLRLFSKFWMEMFCTANSSGPCQQLQAMGPECVDTFLCTQQMIGDLVIRFQRAYTIMEPQQWLTIPSAPGEPDIRTLNDIDILDKVDVSVDEPKCCSYLCQAKSTGHICEVQIFPLDPSFSLSLATERIQRWKEATKECHFLSKIHSVFTDGAFIYFVIEPLVGPTLLDRIRQGTTVSDEAVVKRISTQVMASLEALHRHKIVYCDLCPENVFICQDDNIKLMSYPLIKYICFPPTKKMCLGFVAEYVAPELVLCRRSNVGHAVDLWCFGVLMYEMYTGFPLFCGNSNFPAHVYAQVVSYKEKYCRGYCEHMPEDLREVVCSLLRTPEKRNSISELKKMRFFS